MRFVESLHTSGIDTVRDDMLLTFHHWTKWRHAITFYLLVYDDMLIASELAHPYKQIRFLPFEEKC